MDTSLEGKTMNAVIMRKGYDSSKSISKTRSGIKFGSRCSSSSSSRSGDNFGYWSMSRTKYRCGFSF